MAVFLKWNKVGINGEEMTFHLISHKKRGGEKRRGC